jgi:hypothetical protein
MAADLHLRADHPGDPLDNARPARRHGPRRANDHRRDDDSIRDTDRMYEKGLRSIDRESDEGEWREKQIDSQETRYAAGAASRTLRGAHPSAHSRASDVHEVPTPVGDATSCTSPTSIPPRRVCVIHFPMFFGASRVTPLDVARRVVLIPPNLQRQFDQVLQHPPRLGDVRSVGSVCRLRLLRCQLIVPAL